jgi:hypothetical protein
MSQFFQQYTSMMGFSGGSDIWWAIIILWSLAWKGVALWKAARNNEKYWYIALLIINTVGLLEIVYIFFSDKKRGQKNS